LSPDPSSDLILATKSGSTTPPHGPMPQPEQLKQENNVSRKVLTQQENSTSAKKWIYLTVHNIETKHQQILKGKTTKINKFSRDDH
jgi:hypothetical protein